MKYKVFVDGQEGTTGLKIHEYLNKRKDIEVLSINPEKRKDINEKKLMLNNSDLVFLCLPDEAAKESVSLIENKETRIIDASTAHRTDDNWVYGLPELEKSQREKIIHSRKVSNPGCHSTGFILAIYPLVKNGIIPLDYPVTCSSITGYSGGGKKLIEKYESINGDFTDKDGPRQYALTLNHKHLPEMKKLANLAYSPFFTPIVSNFYKGMTVSVPLYTRLLGKFVTAKDVHEVMSEYYMDEKFIKVMPYESNEALDSGFLDPQGCNDTNRVDLFVFGHETQILIVSRMDNLGKGASGAAVQNMNIMLGCTENFGLNA